MEFIKTDLAKQLEETYPDLDFTPVRGTEGSSGYDLRAAVEAPVTIFPDDVVKIPTGVKLWNGSDDLIKRVQQLRTLGFPGDFKLLGFLLPRSSTKGAILNNTIGLCDEDYQGEIFIKLRNITNESITITTGERFAQLTFMLSYIPYILEEVSEFSKTTTRTGGFGSTGK